LWIDFEVLRPAEVEVIGRDCTVSVALAHQSRCNVRRTQGIASLEKRLRRVNQARWIAAQEGNGETRRRPP
jgi:hypothetical protein